ncbi:MAG TPA: ABC transporter permease, partial [Polyangiaceae bacterium LLY-WYZ-15_(1-7)]|nr:ABC transporter permease [Polyangiaceae bacterium LLY-WYZ-15_(1-7)]
GDEDEHEHEHEDVHGGEHGQVVREAVLGYDVAASLGVAVGSEIEPTHGVEGGTVHEHEHLWTVVGILKPTGTPVDRVVFINLDSFFSIEDHAAGALLPGTDEAGLSSVLVFPRGGVHKAILLGSLNRRPELQVADVSEQLRNLFTIVGSVDVLFLVVAILVVILGILSMLVALYNTMNERRREVAILRALGARRRDVFGAIVGEAALLTALGAAAGLLLGHLLVLAARGYIAEVAGFAPEPFAFLPIEAAVLTLVVLGGALAGLVPAWKAYRTDVAAHLKPLS